MSASTITIVITPAPSVLSAQNLIDVKTNAKQDSINRIGQYLESVANGSHNYTGLTIQFGTATAIDLTR